MIVAKSNLEVAIKASLHAGKEIIRIYNDTKADLELELKTDDSPLTVADRNANEVILSYLYQTSFPVLSASIMHPPVRPQRYPAVQKEVMIPSRARCTISSSRVRVSESTNCCRSFS